MTFSLHNGFSRGTAREARHLSDKVLQSAHDAVESTRDYAHHAIDGAGEQVLRLRKRIDPAVDELAAGAHRVADRGIGIAHEAGSRAQRQWRECAAATERYVSEQPLRAILIAAAAGAVIAVLTLSARKRRETPSSQPR